jgi:hypothetical protein
VDFAPRKAKAAHLGAKPERWEEDVEVEPGKTFAGIARRPRVPPEGAQK